MRYIKPYRLFESVYDYTDDVLKDISDMVIELNDSGRISSHVLPSKKFGNYVGFFIKDPFARQYDMVGFKFQDIEDYVFRIRDYLGDRYLNCSALFTDQYDDMDHTIHRVPVDLDSPEEMDNVRERELKNLIIQIKDK